MRVGCIVVEVSYCSSKKRPAFDAVGVVADFVVVNESKTKMALDSFCESGVPERASTLVTRWARRVVLPEPDSPLLIVSHAKLAKQAN
jgi:hypothetical protein